LTLTPQVEVRDGARFVARLDLADEALRAAAEYDGAEWHSSPDQQSDDRARRADAVAQGYLIEVFTKEDVFETAGRQAEDKIMRLRNAALARSRGRDAC